MAALLAVAVLVAACGSGSGSAAAPGPSAAAPGDAPQRIVSLSASLTEMLFAVGAGDQVVAVDRYSDYPAHAPVTELSGFKPNVEALAALQPDLVVLAADRDGLVEALDRIGVPGVVLRSASSVQETLDQILLVGDLTGHPDQAAAVVATMRAEIASLVARVPPRDAPLTGYIEIGDDGRTATSATFLGDALALAGIGSIADGAPAAAGPYPQLSAEAVLAADPDVIVLARADGVVPTAGELRSRPGWAELRAIRDGHVVAVQTDLATRWGPRVVDMLAAVVDATATIP